MKILFALIFFIAGCGSHELLLHYRGGENLNGSFSIDSEARPTPEDKNPNMGAV